MSEKTRHLSQGEDPVFIDLLAQALEASEDQAPVDLKALCADRPDLLPELQAALAGADDLSQLHESAAGFDPMIGQTIGGRYHLRYRLGSGGMGVVYRAEDTELRRDVALKMLRPDAMSGEELENRLAREAEVLASVKHPAVISVFDRGRSADDRAYVVMPVLEGLSGSELIEAAPSTDATHPEVNATAWVSQLLGEGSLETNFVRQATSWIAQIARGLAVIHEAGVVHRDVKPSNIFLQRDGQPILLDFGLVTFGADTTLAQRDAALGTPAYMAPEQLDPRNEPTPAIDVYGLTATLYHFLTFERPFRGSASQVLAALQRREPRPAGSIRPGLPRDLLAILDRGMAKEPKHRYGTARDLAEDLEAWLDFRPVTARPVSQLNRLARKARRSPVAKTLIAVGILGASVLTTKALLDAREQAQEIARQRTAQEHNEIATHIPTTVLITQGAALRKNPDAELYAQLIRLAETDASPGAGHVLLALHEQQQGRPKKAAETLRNAASAQKSALLNSLADRVAATPPGTPASLESLPEPTSDIERLSLATQLLWVLNGNNITRAYQLASECSVNTLGAAEVALSIKWNLIKQGPRSSYREDYDALIESILQVEIERGFATASLLNTMSVTLLALGRTDDAVEAAEKAINLAPSDYSHWINLGAAHVHSLQRKDAEHALRRALELAPESSKARELLVRAAMNDSDYEEARARVADIPGSRKQKFWSGRVLLQEACHDLLRFREEDLISKDREALGMEKVAEAFELFSSVHPPGKPLSWEMLLCKSLTDPEQHYDLLIQKYLKGRLEWNQLRELGLLLPIPPSPAATRSLQELLVSLSFRLAPSAITRRSIR